jgi:hypothetical protein
MNPHWRDMLAQSVLAVSSRQRQRGKFGGSPTLARNCDEIPNIIEMGCKIFMRSKDLTRQISIGDSDL